MISHDFFGLLLTVSISWLVFTSLNFYINNQDCDLILFHAKTSPLESRNPILPGLSSEERELALHGFPKKKIQEDQEEADLKQQTILSLDDVMKEEEEFFKEKAATQKQAIAQEGNNNNWTDIRIGKDYICCYRDPHEKDVNVGRPFSVRSKDPKRKFMITHIWKRYGDLPTIDIAGTKPAAVTVLRKSTFTDFFRLNEPENSKNRKESLYNTWVNFHPKSKMLIWDIDLEPKQADYIAQNPKLLLKKFDFSKYPDHVRNTDNGAYKIFIWIESLMHFGSIVWFESDVVHIRDYDRAIKANVHNFEFEREILEGKVGTFSAVSHQKSSCFISLSKTEEYSMAHGIHPITYTYLPSNITRHMHPGNFMKNLDAAIMYNTPTCKNEIFRWAMLCAINEECISPKGAVRQCPIGTNIGQGSENWSWISRTPFKSSSLARAAFFEGRFFEGRFFEGRFFQGRFFEGRLFEGRFFEGRFFGGRFFGGRFSKAAFSNAAFSRVSFSRACFSRAPFSRGATASFLRTPAIYQPHLCHKYEQAIINLLLANVYGFNNHLTHVGNDHITARKNFEEKSQSEPAAPKLIQSLDYLEILRELIFHMLDESVMAFSGLTGFLIFFKNKLV